MESYNSLLAFFLPIYFHVPGLTQTELLTIPGSVTLMRLARVAIIPATALRGLAKDLAALRKE
jgi:hypothetical protein